MPGDRTSDERAEEILYADVSRGNRSKRTGKQQNEQRDDDEHGTQEAEATRKRHRSAEFSLHGDNPPVRLKPNLTA